nr:hypothetical protein Iba_scaffold8023CG0030 [Ipomoea batatas]
MQHSIIQEEDVIFPDMFVAFMAKIRFALITTQTKGVFCGGAFGAAEKHVSIRNRSLSAYCGNPFFIITAKKSFSDRLWPFPACRNTLRQNSSAAFLISREAALWWAFAMRANFSIPSLSTIARSSLGRIDLNLLKDVST